MSTRSDGKTEIGGFAIKITNDPGFEGECWGPYDSVEQCREVIAAFVGVPESCTILTTDDGFMYDGRPE